MHPLQGKWKITAKAMGITMELLADMVVSEDEKTFGGSVTDIKNKNVYPIENGILEGNTIKYGIAIKFGLIPFKFDMEGKFYEDNTCDGSAKAGRMEGKYEGVKVIE